MTINPVIDQGLQLYDCLAQICPKELAKLEKAQDKDKPKILNAIAKKVLLTSKEKEGASQIKFKSKTLGWRLRNFFRKLKGISTQKHTNIQDALKTTREYISKSLETLPSEEQKKVFVLRDVINVLIQKTKSGESIGITDNRSIKAADSFSQPTTKATAVSQDRLVSATNKPQEPVKKQPAWYPKYEESFQAELQSAFKEIPFEEFIGTLHQIDDDWSGTSKDTSTSEVLESLLSLAKASRRNLPFTEQQGIKAIKHEDVLNLFTALSKPLELSAKMGKSASPDEAIAMQKDVISKMAKACSAIKNHDHWEGASSAFERINKQKEQLLALNLNAIKELSIPAVTESLQNFQQGQLPDNKVDDLLRICKELERLAPRLSIQMNKLQAGMQPRAASENMTLSEILPTLKDFREASSLLDLRKNQPLAKLLESIDTLKGKLEKAESIDAIREQIRALPAKMQALQDTNKALIDNEYARYFFDEVHISSKPLRKHVASLTMNTFEKKEAPKSLDEIRTLLANKQNELAKCAEGLDALAQLKSILPRVSEKISVKALRQTQTPLSSFVPLLAKTAEWNSVNAAIDKSGGGYRIKNGPSYNQLSNEFKEPTAKALVENERKLENAVADGISFKLDDYVKELMTLSTAFTNMTERYLAIGEQIVTWNTYPKGKFWEAIGTKLNIWAEQAGKINQTLAKQSTTIEQLRSKPKPAITTQKRSQVQKQASIPDISDAFKNAPLLKKTYQPTTQKQTDAVSEDEWDD